AAYRDPPAVPPLRAADGAAEARTVRSLLSILVAVPRRASPGAAPPAPLPDVRPARTAVSRRPLQRLLHVLVPHRPGAPAPAVAALMDPPEGYVAVVCPTCGRGYQTLAAASVAFCSVACAD